MKNTEELVPKTSRSDVAPYVMGRPCPANRVSGARKALEQAMGLMQFSIEHATDAIFWIEAGGAIAYVNHTACDVLGYTRDALTAMNIAEIDPLFARGELPAAAWELLRSNGQSCFETEHLASDGRLIPVEVRTNHMVFEGAEYSCCFVRDLTERRRAEERTRLAQFSVEHAADAVFWVDADGYLFYVNIAACRSLGYSREELLGKSVPAIDAHFGADDWAAHWAELQRLGSITLESTHVARDGRHIPVEIVANYMTCGDKAFNCAFVRDISERKRVEAALQASRQRFMDLVNTTDGVVWEADAATAQFTFVSEQAVRMFGYPLERWYEQDFWANCIHPDDRDWAINYCAERTRMLERHAFEYRFICSDGSVMWVHDVVNVVVENGEPRFMRGLLLDITERQRVEERLRFLAGVFEHAHEGIMITDSSSCILDVNPAFTEITGYRRDEAVGRSSRVLSSGKHGREFYGAMTEALARDGFWRGEMWSRKKNGALYPELRSTSAVQAANGEVSHYVSLFSDISQIKEHQSRLETMAHYDALTHLPNRVLLADRLLRAIAHAERTGRLLAVCYMDLDSFKPVNDQFGHEAGDRLLIQLSDRLQDALRGDDTVARLGGDEFVLLLGDLDDLEACEHALQRVLATVALPIHLVGDKSVSVSASLGVTLFPRDCGDADTLLRHADQALYTAKQSGRNRYHLFDLEHDRRARAHQEVLQNVESGLRAGEFRLFYQPKVDMRLGVVVGVEALIRWQHPERGLLSPTEFLPHVEGTTVAPILGDWVIGEALAQMDCWLSNGIDLPLSINISVNHLTAPGFVASLGAHLARYPALSPARIELEILETAALDDITHVSSLIQDCRRMGVLFSLDDFGAGYSSLTYLRRLPADVLKIDQSFVRDMLKDPEDLAIVDGIIGLTRAFSRSVIAEGVESAEHGVLLMQLGCDLAQGYGIARPMPPENIPAWLEQYAPDPLWTRWRDENWSREDMALLVAAMDHHHDVEYIAQGENGEGGSFPQPLNGFSAWCALHRLDRYRERPEFAAIEWAYRRVHAAADDVLEQRQHNPAAGAGPASELLRTLRDELLTLIEAMCSPPDLAARVTGRSPRRLH